MLNFTADPRLETSEPFTKRTFWAFRRKLPLVTFGTHAGLTILLGYLLDQSARHAGAERWFRCTEDILETELGLVPPAQLRLIALLKTLGYIETQHIGRHPPVRYLRANLEIIERDLLADADPAES